MKCIDDELIQKYLDGETDSQETARIEKHLASCSRCACKVEEHKTFTDVVKNEVGRWGKQPVIVPEFVAPTARKYRLNLKIRHYLYAVSAACAALLLFFLFPERNGNDENNTVHWVYTFDGNFDSNKTVSQQEMTLFMIAPDGNIVEFN